MSGWSETQSLTYDDDAAADPPRTRQRTLPSTAPQSAVRPPKVYAAGPQVRTDIGTAERRVWNETEAGLRLRAQLRAGGEAVAPLYRETMDRVRGDLQKDARAAGLRALFQKAWGTA
ncbi:MAG: hypothetical protein ACREBZ_02845 [Thermoplasmata archaeon]